MKNRKKLNDIFSVEYILNDETTPFYELTDDSSFPLVKDFINENNYQQLNEDFFIGYSADKYISPLFEKIYDKLSGAPLCIELARIIYQRFAEMCDFGAE